MACGPSQNQFSGQFHAGGGHKLRTEDGVVLSVTADCPNSLLGQIIRTPQPYRVSGFT